MTTERYEKLRKDRRMVIVPIDVLVFADLIKDGIEGRIEAEGLPKDALFVTVEKNQFSRMTFDFIYLHESFEKVDDGVLIPTLQVMLTRKSKAEISGICPIEGCEAIGHLEYDPLDAFDPVTTLSRNQVMRHLRDSLLKSLRSGHKRGEHDGR